MNAVVTALAGGVLIGLAAVLLMLALGRIAGIAGIIGGLVGNGAGEATVLDPPSRIGLRAGEDLALRRRDARRNGSASHRDRAPELAWC